jgi:uncharacterized membrane protein YdjX (TVP38/TMEM64 family)
MNAGFSTRKANRKLLIFLIAAALLALFAWYSRSYLGLETLAQQEDILRNQIESNPFQAFFIGFAVYTGISLIPGTGGKAIVYGWLFGFWQAVVIVSVGLAIAAMVIFSLSRYLFRDRIERRYTSFLALMNKHIEKEGAFYLITLRLIHFPYSIVNPVSGASRVKTWTFFWTTVVGLLPANAIWVYVGLQLPSLRDLAISGAASFIEPPLIAALIASATLPFLFRWLVGRFGIPSSETGIFDASIHDTQPEKK